VDARPAECQAKIVCDPLVMTEGESVRLADAMSGKGVVPFDS
jgi:hypothetical protein